MSLLVAGSLDQTSITSPMPTLPMPFLASRSGPGQAAPRASMHSAAVRASSSEIVRVVMLGSDLGTGSGYRVEVRFVSASFRPLLSEPGPGFRTKRRDRRVGRFGG